ncbi:hypothetical protein DM02DRAFT_625704 [Periconia macrospinosa]|uniref:Mid2 domain-containing protein n=1 Tax=Periconia macrospinosa TaxID=97972 RepID=A0A2V1E0I1_9PLEO|nr:hypothetical protein DM02DRAFT_625704 [Periconia macrospinosa]
MNKERVPSNGSLRSHETFDDFAYGEGYSTHQPELLPKFERAPNTKHMSRENIPVKRGRSAVESGRIAIASSTLPFSSHQRLAQLNSAPATNDQLGGWCHAYPLLQGPACARTNPNLRSESPVLSAFHSSSGLWSVDRIDRIMRDRSYFFVYFALQLFMRQVAAQNDQGRLMITKPPVAQPSHCSGRNLFRRDGACQFGQCGTKCLAQGAFCCGPAGTLATSPYWVCDNGACVTSVRGTTGNVDCYDPDNPSAQIQSCIDLRATATCNQGVRCYTCDSEAPYCRWETYIASNSPTLRWFSCDTSKVPDVTLFANTISNNLPSSASATPDTSKTSSSSGSNHRLSTSAIIGIGVGGGLAIVGIAGIIAFVCLKKRASRSTRDSHTQPQMGRASTTELDSRQVPSELNSTTAYYPRSQPATPFSQRYGDVETDHWRHGSGDAQSPYKTPASEHPSELEARNRDTQ